MKGGVRWLVGIAAGLLVAYKLLVALDRRRALRHLEAAIELALADISADGGHRGRRC